MLFLSREEPWIWNSAASGSVRTGRMAACGNEHTAVVGEDGRLWTWGNGGEVAILWLFSFCMNTPVIEGI